MKDVDKRILFPCLSVRGQLLSERSSSLTPIRASFLPPIAQNGKLQRSEASERRALRASSNHIVLSERNTTPVILPSLPVRMDTRMCGSSKNTCGGSTNTHVLGAKRLPVNPITALKTTGNSLVREHVPLCHLNKNLRTRDEDDEGVYMRRRLPVRLLPLEMPNNRLTSQDLKPSKRTRTKRI